MHYSIIKPILKEEKILIDKGSLKTKRKFAFLLEKGDKILVDDTFYANDEVDIVLDYSTTDSKRPKETITIYTINDISRE
ncbi:MAG: hypothetical protein PWP15_720 [Methanothermococcus sp.]|jgi:hypothetical protein|uniref:hypothetical protein n=1 Tax=Methanothermococcus TaxID=155862 RepID=UPI0003769D3D|nr:MULTISPECIES: hypothetical protein [Methanothermococcus]MDK2790213.1 hypothetical protein [Methanothermococcus sp.]MDK2987184.1 hypothetical protein [Methanothermococcus sp.]